MQWTIISVFLFTTLLSPVSLQATSRPSSLTRLLPRSPNSSPARLQFCYKAVMSESSRMTSEGELPRLHIASLTHSEMIMLNLAQLQTLGWFGVDLVLSDDEEERQMVAFLQEERTYLLLVPAAFYASSKNHCRSFVELLCLCSQTITLPLAGKYYDEVTSLLGSYCLNYRYKKGKNVVKLYLPAPCALTYLDFVTFQAVHFNDKNCRQLIALKKANAYHFCLGYFRDELLPALFTSEDESIEAILEAGLAKLRLLYHELISEERFTLVYELMNENGSSLKDLEREIEAMVLARHITTVGDEEYQSLIGQELEGIVGAELEKHRVELLEKGEKQGEFIYVKIVYELLRTFREHGFEVNDDKYLFLTSKVVQNIRLLQQERAADLRAANAELTQTVSLQRQEIVNLNAELETLKQQLQAKRKRDLSIVIEEKEDTHSVKRSTSQLRLHNDPISIMDLKQPLQVLTLNTPALNTPSSKLAPSVTTPSKGSVALSKTNEKKGRAVGVGRRRGELK